MLKIVKTFLHGNLMFPFRSFGASSYHFFLFFVITIGIEAIIAGDHTQACLALKSRSKRHNAFKLH